MVIMGRGLMMNDALLKPRRLTVTVPAIATKLAGTAISMRVLLIRAKQGATLTGAHRASACVFQMSSPAERPYSQTGKYQGQVGPTASKFFKDFEERP